MLRSTLFALSLTGVVAHAADTPEAGLLFHLSGEHGTTADFSAAGTQDPTFERGITVIPDGASGAGLQCDNMQLLAWRAPGNIFAQRGTLAFHWRSRYPTGPTAFPIFRVGYADHSSWDMVWLRIDYNGRGFDAFVTDASLARTRVSVTVDPFPAPDQWIHLALSWDETRGIRFYVDGRLAASQETIAVYDAALDQFGPHSRVISPYQVQSHYNFIRGGDLDEVRIYDRMLNDGAIAALASASAAAPAIGAMQARSLTDPETRHEWWLRYGWNRPGDPPPPLPAGPAVRVRKVEIHDAYDLKRWWWKANDGIRETTWPGVYNRSRLPGRNDYFQLPDWDCYSNSGRSITFNLPAEPWNHLEISGSAWGQIHRVSAIEESFLFTRPERQERTTHRLRVPANGGSIRFTNTHPEEPIGELSAYHVTKGEAPAGHRTLAYRLTASAGSNAAGLAPLRDFIHGRHPADERTIMVAEPTGAAASRSSLGRSTNASAMAGFGDPALQLPLVHVLVRNSWDDVDGGLDGIAIELPAMKVKPTHGKIFPVNLRVKDPLWPLRDLANFNFSVRPGEAKILWLDLRDRLLPPDRPLYLTLAGAGDDFGPASLEGASLRLVFKPREAARAEHEIDRFTQARDAYAMLVEEHPRDPRYDLWNRFKGDLEDLLRVNPDHELGRNYATVAFRTPRPPGFVLPEPRPGVPPWAHLQVELLDRVHRFVTWYIDHRQIENGELGGGLSDDTDLTNLWPGLALIGAEPEKIADSLRRVLEACYANGMFTQGLPTIQTDELHVYEEGINALAQVLMLDYGSPRQLERAMETARGIRSITGINAAGHRHFRSSYYSGTKLATEDPWGWSKPDSYLVLQVPELLVDFNGSPAARKYVLELADGLLAHHRPGEGGASSLPGSIQFATDREGEAVRHSLPWHLFWAAWKWTGERDYLKPILNGDLSALTSVNGNLLDLLSLRDAWRPLVAAAPADPNEHVRAAGSDAARVSHLRWQLDGDKSHLESLYADHIESCDLLEYINTEGSLWIDRVGVPTRELQRARLGGVALVRGALYPGHAVSWRFHSPATAQSVALLLPDATPTGFKVIAYNLDAAPVHATMTGWNVEPGTWEITQGLDTDDDDRADGGVANRTASFGRMQSLDLIFPPRATTVLTFRLQSPGTPYWQRPDLGIDPQDVVITPGEVRVTVHSLGSVPAPASLIGLRDAAGQLIATAPVPPLPAPVDLQPKMAEVVIPVPPGTNVQSVRIEIDPDDELDEITTLNNAVHW